MTEPETETSSGTQHSVVAFMRGGAIEAVAFELRGVAMYFRVEGVWTTECPIDLEDTETIVIQSLRAAEFVKQWDAGGEGLAEVIGDFAQPEDA